MTVAFLRMFGILERWNNNQVTPSLSKPHELSYRSNIICNVHAQYEFTHIPARFAMQNVEGNALKKYFVLGSLHFITGFLTE